MSSKFQIGGKSVEFVSTMASPAAHLFIDSYHYPDLCPECIKPGVLVFSKEEDEGKDNEEA